MRNAWRIVSALLTPAEEPTNDPRVLIDATLIAEKRIAAYEQERAQRMAEYARAWAFPAQARRAPLLAWTREARG
jgi:hypothetical protein